MNNNSSPQLHRRRIIVRVLCPCRIQQDTSTCNGDQTMVGDRSCRSSVHFTLGITLRCTRSQCGSCDFHPINVVSINLFWHSNLTMCFSIRVVTAHRRAKPILLAAIVRTRSMRVLKAGPLTREQIVLKCTNNSAFAVVVKSSKAQQTNEGTV